MPTVGYGLHPYNGYAACMCSLGTSQTVKACTLLTERLCSKRVERSGGAQKEEPATVAAGRCVRAMLCVLPCQPSQAPRMRVR